MEDDKVIHISIVGCGGVGKESLIKTLREDVEIKHINELDEFELAGFCLTEELKKALINCGITAQVLKSITSEEELLDKIAEKWNELGDCENENKVIKKKTQTWKKKKFYE